MLKRLENYILDNEFKVTLLNGKVDVVNYTDIDHFDDNKVMIRHDRGIVIIKGENLIIAKLLTDEILITGKISAVILE